MDMGVASYLPYPSQPDTVFSKDIDSAIRESRVFFYKCEKFKSTKEELDDSL